MSGEGTSTVCLRVVYAGYVQGVGFRWTVSHIARRFVVDGTVRNCADGTVELFAQGERAGVSAFLSEVAAAMEGHIERTDVEEMAVQDDLTGFRILH